VRPGRLFVKGLSEDTDWAALKDHFKKVRFPPPPSFQTVETNKINHIKRFRAYVVARVVRVMRPDYPPPLH
jgi:hypothetical protein